MKKSLIALAVAGAFAAPAFAATSNVDVYGVMNIAIQDTDVAGSDIEVRDNVSRIGFKGTEDLGGGLKAVWQIESGLTAGAGNMVGGGSIGTRNTFIGLSGGFGTFVMGRHDTPYKLGTGSLDIFGDTIGDYNTGRTGVQLLMDAHDHRTQQAIAYISPTWSGFHFAAAAIATNAAGNGNSGDSFDGVSLTGVYSNGPLFVSLSYQNVEDADAFAGLAVAPAASTTDESAAWKLGVGYTFGDTSVGFVYEDVNTDLTAGGNIDRDSWLINAKHAMGPIVLKAQYGQVDAGAADQDAWALGLDYNMSKRTTAYIVYATGDDDVGADVSGWNIGMKHSF